MSGDFKLLRKDEIGRNINNHNKLRTYHMFKSRYEVENYVSINLAMKYRKAIGMVMVSTMNFELLHCGPSRRLF